VGKFPLRIDVRDGANRIVASADATVRVAPRSAGKGQGASLLIIGDSLTAASVYSKQVFDLCKRGGGPRLKMVGSSWRYKKPKGELRHEGYGGWTAKAFATRYAKEARTGVRGGSPFLYLDKDGKPRLDFARYCGEFNDGKGPDFVTILLGCNDTFSSTDESIDARIDDMFLHYDTLVKMIHGVRKDTKIGALLTVPPAASQDAFGANYTCRQTRWQYKRNQYRVVQRMIQRYGGREAENIFLVPANVNLDCERNFPQRSAPWNARTRQKGVRLNNGVHPSGEGYLQIGDSIYCWLKTQMPDAPQKKTKAAP